MCYILETEDQCPEIALEDIEVYKVGINNDNGQFTTFAFGHTYEPDKTYPTVALITKQYTLGGASLADSCSFPPIMEVTNPKKRHISRGYHAYGSINRILRTYPPGTQILIGLFIIPKGAQYYYNQFNVEYVASNIRFVKLVKIGIGLEDLVFADRI